jgi:hypothetical protein
MKSHFLLRTGIFLAVVALGATAVANSVAGVLSSGPLRYSDLLSILPTGQIQAACRASAVSFARSDLLADCAVARSTEALNAPTATRGELAREAQATVIQALSMAPYESKLWLALALLQTRLNKPNGESLRMSYLTGPNAVELVSLRLASVVSNNPLDNSSDLKDLAAGDIRLMLLNRPDLKQTLIDIYRQANSTGRAFIEGRVSLFAPPFLESLKSAR